MTDIWKDFDLDLGVDDVLRGQGADPDLMRNRRPALVRAAERALAEGMSKIRPLALVGEFHVVDRRHERVLLEGGTALTGLLVSHHLSGAKRITAALVTIGPVLENVASRLTGKDPVLALALDGLGNAAVEQVGRQVCGRIGDWAQAKGMQASTPLSPGSPEWPVEIGQPQIFALLEPERAGIQITAGGMMFPQKSISFVTGIGSDMAQTHPCEVCSLKEVCRYRNV
jgi:hypothetical protein